MEKDLDRLQKLAVIRISVEYLLRDIEKFPEEYHAIESTNTWENKS